MPEPAIEITRGNIVECLHRADIAVANSSGELIAFLGAPDRISYLRSAAKPLQALNVFVSGAYRHYALTQREIAVICSSHYAEEIHRETVEAILAKAGFSKDHIRGGTVTSLNPKYALQLAWDHVGLSPVFNDCSGKHAGMLAVCAHRGYDPTTYLHPNHPCQQEICNILADMCDVDIQDLSVGIDGCSAPVHAMPLMNMATGYARLANRPRTPEAYRNGAEHIYTAMTAHPEMISGTGGFCSELIRHCRGSLIGKIGAEGVYCIGVKDKDVGIAIKVENGNTAVLPPIAIAVLEQLELLDEKTAGRLSRFRIMDNTNDLQTVIGNVRPIFSLRRPQFP